MDITEHPARLSVAGRTVTFPRRTAQGEAIDELLPKLSKEHMRDHLETFSSFHTRYYKSDYGKQSAQWLYETINSTIASSAAAATRKASGREHSAPAIRVERFEHSWGQPSLIATIPGRTNRTVVIGAHQDSINLFLPSILAAPGADDDGSGTVTILEALRVLLSDGAGPFAHGNATQTVEFHWYSAEEGGLLGSQAVFGAYAKAGRDVAAMLQQDMTGYVQGTLDAGKPESVGVITDFVDAGLTAFIKKVVTSYCDVPFVETRCGYACSDHASASKAGYPAAFVIESEFKNSDKRIHTMEDKIEYLSFDHMLQHARLTLGLAYELALADI